MACSVWIIELLKTLSCWYWLMISARGGNELVVRLGYQISTLLKWQPSRQGQTVITGENASLLRLLCWKHRQIPTLFWDTRRDTCLIARLTRFRTFPIVEPFPIPLGRNSIYNAFRRTQLQRMFGRLYSFGNFDWDGNRKEWKVFGNQKSPTRTSDRRRWSRRR